MRLFFAFLLLSYSALAQNSSLSANTLSKNLTDNANAVVRLDKTEVTLVSKSKMLVTEKRIITVLKSAGERAINPYAYYDLVTKIKDIEAKIYDASGNEIKKIKKKDFKDISAVSGGTLYGDSRLKYFEYSAVAYPYTIAFSHTYETSNTAFLPVWSPIDEYMVSTERSSYTLNNPTGMELRKKEKNFEGYPIRNTSTGNNLHYELINIPAEKAEMLSPAFFEIEPSLMVGLNDFHLAGVDGAGADWKSFGAWQYNSLIAKRDELSEATKAKMDALVKGIDDPLEKAKKIYQYVQDNTRYISVQLGIGGWMPISAQEVDEVKYGDCKGLTNYTKALLKTQGIESYYSVVWSGDTKRSMESDFASMQGNHVILNIPREEGDVWLECTSQQIPFGFLSDFTDDRDVLVITPEGGLVKHTPAYLNEENKKITKAAYAINDNGTLTGNVLINSHGIQYDNRNSIAGLSEKRRDQYYKEYWSNINGVTIKDVKLLNNKEKVQFIEVINVEAPAYANKVGDELLFAINSFDAKNFVPNRYRNRKQPLEIARGYLDEDTFTVTLPASYEIDNLPEAITVENQFGSYKVSIERKAANELVYQRQLLIKKGRYAKEAYNDYRNFRRAVSKGDNLKLILTKK